MALLPALFLCPSLAGGLGGGLLCLIEDRRRALSGVALLFTAGRVEVELHDRPPEQEVVHRRITQADDDELTAIRHAADRGIRMGVGHTIADYATARAAFDAGATILTHAFNAMPGIHHRDPGPLITALDDDRVTIELILDGVHVVEPVAAHLWRSCPGRLALITDAMSAAGFSDGSYRLGGLAVTVAGGVTRLTGTDTIAGSTLALDVALRRAAHLGVGLQEAVAAATHVPAASLGLGDRHGLLAQGQAADFVLWDDDMHIAGVWRDGCQLSRGEIR